MDEVIQQKWREAAEILTMGVLRNFGGLPEESTCRLLDWAFRCVKTALGKCLPGSRDLLDADFKSCFQSSQGVAGEQRKTQRRQLSVLHALKESLRDNAEPSDDLNHTWYRYLALCISHLHLGSAPRKGHLGKYTWPFLCAPLYYHTCMKHSKFRCALKYG
eukprot:3838113-Amphidinium_carterae.1